MNRTAITCTSIASLALMGGAAILSAGPLDPPAGPVTATYKTLTDVEPRMAISAASTPGDADSVYRISSPGSYYLTGNVVSQAGKSGIEIAASDVTIDLNGFQLTDAGTSTKPGIVSAASTSNIAVRNGSLRWQSSAGLSLSSTTAVRIEDVAVHSSGSTGISVGSGSFLSRCAVVASGGIGIITGASARVESCSATSNTSTGISVSTSSVVANCTAASNGGNGIGCGLGSTLDHCASYDNSVLGIALSSGSTASNCAAYLNALDGFFSDPASTITACSASDNGGNGFRCYNSTLQSCTAYSNTLSGYAISGRAAACEAFTNSEQGFTSSSGLIAEGCMSNSNFGSGFVVGSDSLLKDCRGIDNAVDGARIGNDCVVEGSLFTGQSSGHGILATGPANRIQNNHISSNSVGIGSSSTDSIVINNTARNNLTHYSLAGNEYGQIIINPGAGFVSTNAWANFAY